MWDSWRRTHQATWESGERRRRQRWNVWSPWRRLQSANQAPVHVVNNDQQDESAKYEYKCFDRALKEISSVWEGGDVHCLYVYSGCDNNIQPIGKLVTLLYNRQVNFNDVYSKLIYLSNEWICDDDQPSAKEGSWSVETNDPVRDDQINRRLDDDQRQLTDGLCEVVSWQVIHTATTLLGYDSVLRWNCKKISTKTDRISACKQYAYWSKFKSCMLNNSGLSYVCKEDSLTW